MAVDSQWNIFHSHYDWSSAVLSCLFLVSSVPPGSRSVDGCQSLSALWCPLPTTLSSINCPTLLSPHPHTPTTCRLISTFQIQRQLFRQYFCSIFTILRQDYPRDFFSLHWCVSVYQFGSSLLPACLVREDGFECLVICICLRCEELALLTFTSSLFL